VPLRIIAGVATVLILIPIPSRDFDPTETAVPWKTLAQQGPGDAHRFAQEFAGML